MRDQDLRLAMIVPFEFPGATGSPILAMDLCREFATRVADVCVVRYSGKLGRLRRRSWKGIDVYDVPLWAWAVALPWILLRRRTQVIHAHTQVGAILGWIAARLTGRAIVYEMHAIWADVANPTASHGLVIRAEAALLRRYDEVITLSHPVMEEVARVSGGRARARVLYPPAPPLDLPPVTAAERPHVLYMGNFFPWQGLGMLLDALAIVASRDPAFTAEIVGGTEDDLAAPDRGRALPPQVRFTGRVAATAVADVLARAHIVVIPRPDLKTNKTTARKLGELLSSGRYLVVTAVADHPRLLDGAPFAAVVPPTTEGLVAGLETAIDAIRSGVDGIDGGRAIARRRFGEEATVQARLEVFRETARRDERARGDERVVGAGR